MTQFPSGVNADRVVLASVQLSGTAYQAWQQVADTQSTILEHVRQQAGVTNAGMSIRMPFETGWRMPFFMNEQRPSDDNNAPQAQDITVSDGFFETMGAHLVSGRFFDTHDTAQTEGVVVVNEAFAKRYATGRPVTDQRLTTYSVAVGPLGRNLMAKVRPDNHVELHSLKIVGVVGDIPNAALGQPVEPSIYYPETQFPFRSMTFAIAARDATTAIAAMKRALADVAPTTPMGPSETWASRFEKRTAEPRVLMATLSAFGVLAAILAALGVYGLFSWSVASRRRELAIRLTLGARPATIGALVLRQGAWLVAAGLAGGWLIIFAARTPIATLLFRVAPGDPAAMTTAAALIAAASVLACLPAARRAMRVNPNEGLRTE
jgi:hypothetical protein